jgi:hypothetical protein
MSSGLVEVVFPFSVEFGLVVFGLIEVVFPFSVDERFELMISVFPNSGFDPRFPFSELEVETFPFSEEFGLVEVVFPFSEEFGLEEVVFPFSVEVRFELMISEFPNS